MVVRTIILWWVLPIRIGRFDVRVAKEMFHFGMHMSFSTVGLWLIKNLDRLFVGRYMGQTALGYYTLAFTLSNMIAVNVARMLGTVLFPAFAEIGHDYDRVRGAWLQAVRYSMVGIVPLGAAVITFAPEILLTFFPQRPIVTVPLAILTVCAVARGVGVPLGDLAKGIGKPAILTRVAFWHVVVLAPLLFVVTSDVFSARTVLMVASLAVSGSSSLAVLIAVSLVVSGSHLPRGEVHGEAGDRGSSPLSDERSGHGGFRVGGQEGLFCPRARCPGCARAARCGDPFVVCLRAVAASSFPVGRCRVATVGEGPARGETAESSRPGAISVVVLPTLYRSCYAAAEEVSHEK